ncbi:complement factor B-like [Pseudophryne corroboree]|uniref:complement factor B-like n=1 Tax=Pseudophryne corroboree TaxID=495146 RepID=UPI003081BC27
MLPLLVLSHLAVFIAAAVAECDLSKAAIVNGTYTVSDEGNTGSVVTYKCPKGMYPYPDFSRRCLSGGYWEKENKKAECKPIQCPRQIAFDGGDYYPRKRFYYVGDVLTFECYGGFKMFGPGNHTCQENGKWSGELTICDDEEGYCPNPGIPFGATKVGSSYKIESKVKYQCQNGLEMFGSSERKCMEEKYWSGAEPSCRDYYTYDTPKEVAASFQSSLAENFESADPDKVEGQTVRKIGITKGGLINIFILMDASKSVGEDNFQIAQEISNIFIDKISSYDINPQFAVISYASAPRIIVRLSDVDSANAAIVMDKIADFKYAEHADKQGTNTRAALAEVHNMLSLQKLREAEKFKNTRNVIVLMTDGKHNMGGDPTVEIRRMRDLLDISSNREEFLDIYVFGLGDVSHTEVNDIASKKPGERHSFRMENVDDMKKAFTDIIDETQSFHMCGLSKEKVLLSTDKDYIEKFPWIAKVVITRPKSEENCKGSIVSKNFILTAAHCFYIDEELHTINVDIGDKKLKVKNLYRHPNYKPDSKKDKNVPKTFDYDVALLELTAPLTFSAEIRPICIPCTSGTSWALKQRGKDVTCKDQRSTLLSNELVPALFITEEEVRKPTEKNVQIKQGTKREACLADTSKIPDFENVTNIRDVVTDNFFCTGGIDPVVDPQTCKGDSGGPLIVLYRKRYIQVGIISWGTVNSCEKSRRKRVPPLSWDLHIDVFHMMSWIKGIVKDDLEYLD